MNALRPLLLSLLAFACAPQTETKTAADDSAAAAIPQAKVTADGGAVSTAKGSSVTLPPGAVAAGTDLVVSEVAAPLEFAATTGASTPIEILATAAGGAVIDRVSTPATVAVTIDGAALALAAAPTDDNLCMLLKTRANGLFVWRRADLTIDVSARKAVVSTLFFGTFQVAYCGSDALAGFSDSKEQAAAAAKAEANQAAATAKAKVTMTVPAGFQADIGAAGYCVALFSERKSVDGESGTGTGTGSDTDSENDVVAVAQASAGGAATMVLEADAVDPKSTIYVGLTLHAAGVACPFSKGTSPGKQPLGTALAAHFWAVDGATLEGGVKGEVGDAAGPFRTGTATVEVGVGTLTGFAGFSVQSVCLDADFLDASKSLLPARIETDAAGVTTINGKTKLSFLTALAPKGSPELKMKIRIGEGCRDFDSGQTDAATGLPYALSFSDRTIEQPFTIAPTKLLISNKNALTQALNGCITLCPGDGDCSSKNLGRLSVKLANGGSYPVYLPFLDAPREDGAPVYDLTVDVLQAGGACDSGKSAGFPQAPLKHKVLAPTIGINL